MLNSCTVNTNADKALNNIVFVCKTHCIDCLIKKLGNGNSLDNPTYTSITRMKKETLVHYRSVLCFVRNSTKDEELDLLSLY